MTRAERHELLQALRGTAVGWRFSGLALLAIAGAVLAMHPEARAWWGGLLAAGVVLCAIATVKRTAFRRRWLDDRGIN